MIDSTIELNNKKHNDALAIVKKFVDGGGKINVIKAGTKSALYQQKPKQFMPKK